MANWEHKDGTKIKFESWEERDTRLADISKRLYQICKEKNVTIRELRKITENLLNLAESTHL